MRGWGVWVWVGVALVGCVDPFPEVTAGGAGEDGALPDARIDMRADAALIDATTDGAPPDMPPGDGAPPDMPVCRPTDEICNGIDDDCDGSVDEAQPRRACPLTEGVCAGATVGCVDGAYGDCNYGLAIAEYEEIEGRCDGLDNDCDGERDEGCACSPGDEQPCGLDTGDCQPGVQTCGDDGRFGECVGQIGADVETCNGADDDCDGAVDEDTDGPCMSGALGRCAAGIGRCVAGVLQCTPERAPTPEECNGADDDCDGTADEALDGQECRTGEFGICAFGVAECTLDGLRCVPLVLPDVQPEVCNGLDDDCDGTADNLPVRACDSGGLGACAPGREACAGGNLICQPIEVPRGEDCDGVDNDCDGVIDESVPAFPCMPDEVGACGMGVTRCVAGVEICEAPGLEPDLCDGVDTDCDGAIDEDVVAGQRCPTDLVQCPNGVQRCDDGVVICALVPTGGTDEGPDGVDDDCDGVVDEDRLTLYLEDLMMGGDGTRPGRPAGYIPGFDGTVYRDGAIPPVSPEPFINRVFRPNAQGAEEVGILVSSTNLRFDFGGDVGSVLSWTAPSKGPLLYLDNDANLPIGVPIIELHANMGITFDLNPVRARYPGRQISRFRGRVGARGAADVGIIMLRDGVLAFRGACARRQNRNTATYETIPQQDLTNTRFLTFAAVDCDNGDISSRHGFLLDARIELERAVQVGAEDP